MTAFTYRFAPSMRYLKHLVTSGSLGVPRHFRSQRFLDLPETSWGWRQYKQSAGAGDLYDMTIHRIDFAMDLLGPIESLCGAIARFAPRDRTAEGQPCAPSDVDDWSAFLGRFQSGAVGVWEGSTLMKGHHNGGVGKKFLPETMGSGVVFFDFDADGWQDLFLVNAKDWPGAALPKRAISALYRNIRGTFSDNVVAGNWLGLQLFSNSEATRITGNALFANTFAATGGADSAAYSLCVDGRGNYWGAGSGYDLAGDGVLDRPHAASSPLAELALSREGLRLWLSSPAAQTLAWAERTFPVFAVNGAVDRCPLAAPPRPVMLTRLPPAPLADAGGRAGQSAAAGVTLLLGLAAFATSLPTRRRRS